MPKLNVGRTVQVEADLAKRIAYEREKRGQSHEVLADLMTKAGCAIAGSSIYKIEKGSPRRRISVDEFWTLAEVWGLDREELATPVELLEQQRAKEIAAELQPVTHDYYASIRNALRLFVEYARIAAEDPELLEFMNGHIKAGATDITTLASEDFDGLDPEQLATIDRLAIELYNHLLKLAYDSAEKD